VHACTSTWFALTLAMGCSLHPEGIADLVGDGYSYVGFPGRRVLDGKYSSVRFAQKTDGALVVLGISDAGQLSIGELATGARCSVGAASAFRVNGTASSSASGGWVAYLHDPDADGWATLAFATLDCTQQIEATENAKLSMWLGGASSPRFLAWVRSAAASEGGDTAGGDAAVLSVCDPTRQPACTGIAPARTLRSVNGLLFTLETYQGAQALVVRDQWLDVLMGVGTSVTDFVVGSQGNWVAYIDQSALWLASMPEGNLPDVPRQLASDACELTPVLSRTRPGGGFTYRSPCAGGSLHIYDDEGAISGTEGGLGPSIQPSLGALAPAILEQTLQGDSVALYLTDASPLEDSVSESTLPGLASLFRAYYGQDAPNSTGTLVAITGGRQIVGPSGVWLGSLQWSSAAHVRMLAQFDGTSGTLVDWDWEQNSSTEVASAVTDYLGNSALVRAADGSQQFVDLIQKGHQRTVLDNVFERGDEFNDYCVLGSVDCISARLKDAPNERLAVLNDVSSDSGKLWLLTRKDSTTPLASPEFWDDGVSTRGYRFLSHGDAVLYFRNADSTGAGTLTARFVDTLDAFQVEHATWWLEVTGELPGVFYATDSGAKSGLWFAGLY
jgi:hypothetical protein